MGKNLADLQGASAMGMQGRLLLQKGGEGGLDEHVRRLEQPQQMEDEPREGRRVPGHGEKLGRPIGGERHGDAGAPALAERGGWTSMSGGWNSHNRWKTPEQSWNTFR
jgi:hypothetical protein